MDRVQPGALETQLTVAVWLWSGQRPGGVAIVLTILLSAGIAGYQSIVRFFHPQAMASLETVVAASVIGFLGNEAVAVFRIRVGKEVGSAALTADGYHARVDGLTSLAVLVGAAGVWLGYPAADPIVGLIISAVILRLGWQSGKAIFTLVKAKEAFHWAEELGKDL